MDGWTDRWMDGLPESLGLVLDWAKGLPPRDKLGWVWERERSGQFKEQ